MKKALFTKDYSRRSQFAKSFLAESGCILGIYIYPKNRDKEIEKVAGYQYFTYENISDTNNWLKINSLLSDQTAVVFDNPSRYPKISSPKYQFLSKLGKLTKHKAIIDIVPFTIDIQYLYTPFSHLGREILGYAHYYAFRENYHEVDSSGDTRFSHDFDLLAEKVAPYSEIDYGSFLCPSRDMIPFLSTAEEMTGYQVLRDELFEAKAFSPSVTITKLADHVHAFGSRSAILLRLLSGLTGKTVILTNLKSYAQSAQRIINEAGFNAVTTSYQLGFTGDFDNCIYLESPIVKSYYLLDVESRLKPGCKVFHILGDTKVDQYLYKTLIDEITQIDRFTQELSSAKRRQASQKAIPAKERTPSSSGADQMALF
jgi:hypothetical protein